MNKTLKVYQIINVNARIKNVIEGDSAINAAFKFKLLRLYSEIQEINAVSDSDVDVNFTPISTEELFSMGLDTDACADLIPIVEE